MKPLVEMEINGKEVKVFPDGSYIGAGVTKLAIQLPDVIRYSETIREAAREANLAHTRWNERWHSAR